MTDDPKRIDRVIDLTIDIDATLDDVWQALTTGEGIARWFAPYAAVTPGEGGSVSVGWDQKEMWDTPITGMWSSAVCRVHENERSLHLRVGRARSSRPLSRLLRQNVVHNNRLRWPD